MSRFGLYSDKNGELSESAASQWTGLAVYLLRGNMMSWSGPLRTFCLAAIIIMVSAYASFAQHGGGFHGGGFHSGGRTFGGFHRGGGFATFHGGAGRGFHHGGYGYYGSHYHGGYYPHPYYGYPYYGYPPYSYGFSIGFGLGPFWGYWGSPYAYGPYPSPYPYYAPYGYYRHGGPYNGQGDPKSPRDQADYRRTVPRPPRQSQARCDYRYEGTCGPSEEHRPATQQDETLPEDAPRVYLIKNPAQ